MSSQFRNIKQITRRLFDEVLNNAYRSFRADSEPARSLQLTQLEQRVLMSASPAVVVADMVDAIVESDALTPDAAMLTESSNSEVNQNNAGIESDLIQTVELVVIDPSASDYQELVADLQSQSDRVFEILILNPRQDGISQITDALKELSDVSAIHLVSHGDEGESLLGASVLSQRSIERYAAELVTWQYSMTADADLLIYGCDLAASEDGIALTESLNILLGTDVAASDDLTGHKDLGGDWDLEVGVGSIETAIAFTTKLQSEWTSLLTLNAYESFSYPAGTLEAANGGSGFSTAWTKTSGTTANVNATGLTAPAGLPAALGGAAEMNTVITFSQSRDLSTTLGTEGTTAWFSFLLKPDGTSGGMSFVIGDGDGATNTVNVGTSGADFLIGPDGLGTGSKITGAVVDAQTFFLVVQVDFAAGNDTATLYLNPTAGASQVDSKSSKTPVFTEN